MGWKVRTTKIPQPDKKRKKHLVYNLYIPCKCLFPGPTYLPERGADLWWLARCWFLSTHCWNYWEGVWEEGMLVWWQCCSELPTKKHSEIPENLKVRQKIMIKFKWKCKGLPDKKLSEGVVTVFVDSALVVWVGSETCHSWINKWNMYAHSHRVQYRQFGLHQTTKRLNKFWNTVVLTVSLQTWECNGKK